MFCGKCGAENQEHYRYCKECGVALNKTVHTKKLPFWFKATLSTLALLVLWQSGRIVEFQSLTQTVEGQLSAIRSKRFTEAYYSYASQEFQKITSLSSFSDLLRRSPELTNNRAITFQTPVVNEDLAYVKGAICSEGHETTTPVEYELIKENKKWKIMGMLLATPTTVNAVPPTPQGSLELIIPIDIQLGAFRENNIEKAYQESTAEDFKKVTTLDVFKKFVERYPILFSHKQISIKSQQEQGDKANVMVLLDPEGANATVQYMLIKENGRWKIWSMNVLSGYSHSVSLLLKDPDSLKKPIEEFLKAIQDQNLSSAYYSYTSKEFQSTTPLDGFRKFIERFPILTQFETIELKHPVIEKSTGKIEASLRAQDSVTSLDFTLGIEDEVWKIWALQILKQTVESRPAVTTGSSIPTTTTRETPVPDIEEPNGGPLQFTKFELGNKIDEKGEIVNPETSITTPHEDIFVNLYIRNGTAGTEIDVRLKHVETQSELPLVSTTLQQAGNSVVSFSFSPPATGWPKGTYQLQAKASSGVKNTFTFIVE